MAPKAGVVLKAIAALVTKSDTVRRHCRGVLAMSPSKASAGGAPRGNDKETMAVGGVSAGAFPCFRTQLETQQGWSSCGRAVSVTRVFPSPNRNTSVCHNPRATSAPTRQG